MARFLRFAGISGILSGVLVGLIYLYPFKVPYTHGFWNLLLLIAVLLSVALYVGLGFMIKSRRAWIPVTMAMAVDVSWALSLSYTLTTGSTLRLLRTVFEEYTWPLQLLLLFASLTVISAGLLARGWRWFGLTGTLVGAIAAAVIAEELLLFSRIIRTSPISDLVFTYLISPHLLGSAFWQVIMGVAVLRFDMRS